MVDAAMFASGSEEWGTDPNFVKCLEKLFGPFKLDPCARVQAAAKAPRFYSPAPTPGSSGVNGLLNEWDEDAFVNPPWRKANKKKNITALKIEPWIVKAIKSRVQTTLLLPARTETTFFAMAFSMAHTIAFVKGRLEFQRMLFDANGNMTIGGSTSAPFPSVVMRIGEPRPHAKQVVGLINRNGDILV